MDRQIPDVVVCECGLRYVRTAVRGEALEVGHQRCTCGNVLGAWHGYYRLVFELEGESE